MSCYGCRTIAEAEAELEGDSDRRGLTVRLGPFRPERVDEVVARGLL